MVANDPYPADIPVLVLKVVSGIALVSFPFALADAGDPGSSIPLICLVVGIPHLVAIATPVARPV
jgi:hypothetical protein